MWNFFRHKRQQDIDKTAVDPICGMTVEKATALKSERDGQTYCFCSQTCLHTFESQPAG
ncbi:YHS domain-containing protein [Nostoc punctiforme FACHB-252]|uniref:YHS domain-containing protein n=1 Tax=Nostoc punctiforme FACHB-252 TaxID=1357509 RepID=A0ABR8HDS6_NOSPU|nr:YHS domain-containing protein [Nostoc punctiforme]MBD2613922.1 YHS domain-containing protein [Nostoc punctiforme FACHB-252]MBD2613985.1 YHS domain-containing protein [Nostoc punctiforme FACHB-252]